MRQYEAVFIIDSALSGTQVKETVDKLLDVVVKKVGGEVRYKEFSAVKRLAYPIKGKKTGFYSLVEFLLAPDKLRDLEIAISRQELIMRHLVVSMDPHAVAFAERRRTKKRSESKEKE